MNTTVMAVRIYSEKGDFYIEDITEFYKEHELIVAAGGLVKNDEGELLLIFRRGKWDLPKGKVDKGESLETCVEREIKEETGIKKVMIEKPLITTHHVYTEKGKNILKETHWFAMSAPGRQKLEPQTDEDIDKAEWVAVNNLSKYTNNTYSLIKDVLSEAGY